MAFGLKFVDGGQWVPWRGIAPAQDASEAMSFQSREEAAQHAIANYISPVDRLYGTSPVMVVGLPDTSEQYSRFANLDGVSRATDLTEAAAIEQRMSR